MKDVNIKNATDLTDSDAKKLKGKDLIVFDLDGTLAKSKQKIEKAMADLFCELLKNKKVAVISGGDFEQFKKQLLSNLSCNKLFENLYLFPTNSTAFYKYKEGWNEVYKENLSSLEKNNILSALKKAFYEVGYTPPQKTYGVQIEDRDTQITFSALGQDAPLEKKREWNEKKDIREKLIEEIEKHLHGFEIRSGGLTSIDITKEGIDKAYGIRKIKESLDISIKSMAFIGDALTHDGNDYPAATTGIQSINTSNTKETREIIKKIIESK